MPVTEEQEAILRSIGTALKETRDGLRNESALSQRAVLDAVGRMAEVLLHNRVNAGDEARNAVAGMVPDVRVVNEVLTPEPRVTVQVDMTPVAGAVGRMAEAVERLGVMMAELARAVADMPAPVVKNTVNVPEASVTVEPPHVTVEAPKPRKRRMKVKHDDGSESVITEE